MSLAAFGFGAFVSNALQPAPADMPARPEYYLAHVKPIFDGNCARCHGGNSRRGGLSLDTRSAMLHGGNDGPALVPGDPDHSLLIRLIRHQGPADNPMPMPPRQPQLADTDIQTVSNWIRAGAPMPADRQ